MGVKEAEPLRLHRAEAELEVHVIAPEQLETLRTAGLVARIADQRHLRDYLLNKVAKVFPELRKEVL